MTTNATRRKALRDIQRVCTRVAAGHLTPAEGVAEVARALRGLAKR